MRAITICPPLKGWFNSLPLRPLQHISATIPNGVGIDEDIQHWLRFAESDMVSAEALHRGARTERLISSPTGSRKTLKALLLRRSEVQPPRIHGLRGLSERCGLRLTKKQTLLIENLRQYYVESRYPGDWDEGPSEATTKEVEMLIPETKEFIEWLQSQIYRNSLTMD